MRYSAVTGIRIGLFLVSIAALGLDAAFAQKSDPLVDEIVSAFAGGKSRLLLAMTSNPVEIALLGESRKYSKNQASHVLRRFFDQYHPHGFEIRDSTRVTRGRFIEGILNVKPDDGPFLIYLRLGRIEDAWLLREILIERPRS